MANQIKSLLNRTGEFFRKTEKKKLIFLGISTAVVLAAGIIGAVLLNQVDYTVLYSGLSADEAGTIKNLLDEKGVSSKVQGTDTILVPNENADELRIELAADGYPDTGLNYDIFSNSSELGATDLERQTYLQYQLQEDMRKTINRMNKVEDCIVIVNLSDSSSFVLSENTTEASVAVMVSLGDGEKLTNSEARTLGEFVAKCVPDLEYENISIVDSNLNYYDILADDGVNGVSESEFSSTQQDLTKRVKDVLNEQVVSVLEPAVGSNNLAVSVNVALDFDKQTSSEVQYTSPFEESTDGIVRSSEVLNELTTDGSGTGASGEAGTDSNGVSASEYVYGDDIPGLISQSSSETYNYEINEVRTDVEKAQGTIKSLSVSVLVNSNIEGIANYKDEIENLVANAIGVNSDYITVELMPFVQSPGEMSFDDYMAQSQQELAEYNKNRLIRLGIIGGAVLLAALILLLIRLRKKKKKAKEEAAMAAEIEAAANAAVGTSAQADSKMDVENMLDALVTNKSNEAEVVEELMDKYPETVVQILRTWLSED